MIATVGGLVCFLLQEGWLPPRCSLARCLSPRSYRRKAMDQPERHKKDGDAQKLGAQAERYHYGGSLFIVFFWHWLLLSTLLVYKGSHVERNETDSSHFGFKRHWQFYKNASASKQPDSQYESFLLGWHNGRTILYNAEISCPVRGGGATLVLSIVYSDF